MDTNFVKGLVEERARAWEQAKEILDRCAQDKRERSAEEEVMYERANGDIERLGRQIQEWHTLADQERQNDVSRAAFEGILTPEVEQVQRDRYASALERWFRTGDASGLTVRSEGGRGQVEIDMSRAARATQMIRQGADEHEVRALYTDGGASAGSLVVPVSFERTLYQYLEASSAIRRISYVMTTDSGNPMTFPTVATHGVGTQVKAQGTIVGGTDPVFGTIRLDSYKYGQLVKVSNEAVADTGFDLLGFIAQNIGRAVGRITDTAYVTGGGSTTPNGVLNAASVGVTTGGSLIALSTVEKLIDLQHSIVDEYRANASFVMNDQTAGTIRKIRDGGGGTVGSFIWTPATTFAGIGPMAMPDRLLGANAYTDVNYGTTGSAVKVVTFGDFSTFYIRDSGGFRFERSDDRYFDEDSVGFRGILRTDSDLIDTNAIKHLQQAV